MPASARALLSELPKGHEFSSTTFTLAKDDVARYLDAVDDRNAVYAESGLAPPLCAAASALGGLLELLELPAGTLHTGQEIDVRGGVPIGATLTLSGRVSQRSERAGVVIISLDFELTPAGSSEAVLSGRTTVVVAGGTP